eukprot:113165_1
MEDQDNQTSDDEALQEMMEVDFPSFGDDEVDRLESNTNSSCYNDNASKAAPIVDIEKQGWSDDAIVQCLNLSMAYHDETGGVSGDCSRFEFVPVPNMKRDVFGKVHNLADSNENMEEIATRPKNITHKENPSKGQSNAVNGMQTDIPDTWVPSEMAKPKWASSF